MLFIMSRTSFRVNPHDIVCLNVKEFLARSRRHIWDLSDSNEIRTHSHLLRKRTLSHLAKLAWPVWLNGWVFVYELSDCGFESRWCHLIAVLLLLSELLHFSRLSSMVFEFFLLVKSILTLLRQPYPTLLHLVFCCRLLWLIDVILSRYQVITRFVEGLH